MSNPTAVDEHIAKILADAPELNDDKRRALTILFGGDVK